MLFEAVESGIKGPLLHEQNIVRDLLDPFGDGPPVQRGCRDGFEDEKVEGALDEVGRLAHTMIIYNLCR